MSDTSGKPTNWFSYKNQSKRNQGKKKASIKSILAEKRSECVPEKWPRWGGGPGTRNSACPSKAQLGHHACPLADSGFLPANARGFAVNLAAWRCNCRWKPPGLTLERLRGPHTLSVLHGLLLSGFQMPTGQSGRPRFKEEEVIFTTSYLGSPSKEDLF